MTRARAWILMAALAAGCAPHQDPTTVLASAPTPGPQLTGPGVQLTYRRKGDLTPAVTNIWVEDSGQNDVVTLATYDANAWSYPTNPYSCFLIPASCPCNTSCGPANAELAAYWPRFWPKSNYGQLVDAASHATVNPGSLDHDIVLQWLGWRDRSNAVLTPGTYRLWVELSSYAYGASGNLAAGPSLAPTGYVDLVRNGLPGSAAGVVVQGGGLLALSAVWQ